MRSIHRTTRGLAAAFAIAIAIAGVLAAAGTAHAQLALEARGGIALPQSEMEGDVSADGGRATEVSLTIGAFPFVGIYGAYQHAQFDREGSTSGAVITDEGWGLGVRVGVPTPFIPIDPWIRAGVTYHRLEAGGLEDGGSRAVGVEVGGGLRFPLGPGLSLTPGVSWTRYGFDDDAAADGRVDVRYLRADVGLRFGF